MSSFVIAPRHAAQEGSAGGSCAAVHDAALKAARPKSGLSWLDVGCGTGELLRSISRDYDPARLVGIDIIDWLADDLRTSAQMVIGPAESALARVEPADRVLLVETIEHLEAPWTVLRGAARLVLPGGVLVVSTPNVTTLRHRLELALRGRLTSFRPDNEPHLGPILPHVVTRILREEGLDPTSPDFTGRDIVPFTGGTLWPLRLHHACLSLSSVSVIVAAERRTLFRV